MQVIIFFLINAISAMFAGYILPGVHVDSFLTALGIALVIALLSAVLKPIMVLLTLPITILTFGLFLLIINGFIVILADKLIAGFSVDSIWWAILFSIFVSAVASILGSIIKEK